MQSDAPFFNGMSSYKIRIHKWFFLLISLSRRDFFVNAAGPAAVINKAHPELVSFSTRYIVKEMAIMNKFLAVLAAGLFAAGAFAQAPASPASDAAPASLAAPAAPAHMAKAPVKKHTAHKKVSHKKVKKHAAKAV
ncbi:hypothetical protein [Simplicispira psychrophila]|uniref:hypothetical protein n=1 Tax=Simplicispira psychrophila TaxID=80882 RepID=UPI00316AECE6